MVLGFLAACDNFRDSSPRSNYLGRVGRLQDCIPSVKTHRLLMSLFCFNRAAGPAPAKSFLLQAHLGGDIVAELLLDLLLGLGIEVG